MRDLLKSVWERLQRSATFAGRSYLGLAPANAAMPYVVMEPGMSIAPDYNTGEQYMQTRTIRFSVYSTSALEAAEYVDALEATMRAATMAIDDGHVLHVMKGGDDLDLDPDRAENGQEVWHGVIDLDFRIQRSAAD